jgi:hypothetical protein
MIIILHWGAKKFIIKDCNGYNQEFFEFNS